MSKASARHKNLGKDPKNIAAKIAAKHDRNREANTARFQANLDRIEQLGLQRLTITKTRTLRDHRGAPLRDKTGTVRTVKREVLESPSRTLRRYERSFKTSDLHTEIRPSSDGPQVWEVSA